MLTHLKARNNFFTLLCTVVYVAFYIVQLFFNFDNTVHLNSSTSSASVNIFSIANKNILTEKNTSPSAVKVFFRLNKRFQPKNISVCNVGIISHAVLVYPILMGTLYSIHIENMATTFLDSYPLRGPPSIG